MFFYSYYILNNNKLKSEIEREKRGFTMRIYEQSVYLQ
jgi:hypothetical protein